jgi:hypothetical protein
MFFYKTEVKTDLYVCLSIVIWRYIEGVEVEVHAFRNSEIVSEHRDMSVYRWRRGRAPGIPQLGHRLRLVLCFHFHCFTPENRNPRYPMGGPRAGLDEVTRWNTCTFKYTTTASFQILICSPFMMIFPSYRHYNPFSCNSIVKYAPNL